MSPERKVKRIISAVPTMEGAGVRLKRVFGFNEVPLFDPFLLLDDFHSDNPGDYLAGFPWHPHRGIETVTYMIHGEVEHGDSLGNKGIIKCGDMQWMTAGSGIIHQEMPQKNKNSLWGLQLWINLPADQKMMNPRYRDITADCIPEYNDKNGIAVKILSGTYKGHTGPVEDIICDPEYLDIQIPVGKIFTHRIPESHTAFAYILEGEGYFDSDKNELIKSEQLALFDTGEQLSIETAQTKLRFILISGMPIYEPVAWRGPIVMNNNEELAIAFDEYRNGTFIKS